MEIQKTRNLFAEPYAANLEKSLELRDRLPAEDSERIVSAGGDKVTVSQEAMLMTEARRTAQNTPDMRGEKVENLRIQIANDSYKPDSRLIAQNLLREEPNMFNL